MADRYEKNLNRLSAQFGNASKAIAGAHCCRPWRSCQNEFTSGNKTAQHGRHARRRPRRLLETVAVLGAKTFAFVFKTGSEIGGTAAQAATIAKPDFKGAKFIGEAMREDAAKPAQSLIKV